ncbi:MAG TPA: acyltransferase [Terracidiphilus sp.]|nr:acyltransferase [Terracidiphilus sp.]
MKTRLHGLDTLRSAAILAVIVYHVLDFGGGNKLPAWLESIAQFGWMGVDLFFVLSGFLIGSQLLRPCLRGETPSLLGFYRNRAYRILPAYLAVLALYEWMPAWRESSSLAPAWAFLTFTANFVIVPFDAHAFSHAWSLCVEEHFYLALPLIVIVMIRRPSARKTITVLAAFIAIGIGMRAFVLFHSLRPLADAGQIFGGHYLGLIYYATYCHFDGLLAGILLAILKSFRPEWWARFARRGHLQTLAALALIVGCLPLFRYRYESVTGITAVGDVIGFPVLSLGLGLLVASALSDNGLLSRFRVPGAKLVATLAYSLYLTQKEMIHLVSDWFPSLESRGGWRWLLVYALCSFAVAAALYLFVERPFLLLRDRRREQPARLELQPARTETEG